jgi:hypothetical protein
MEDQFKKLTERYEKYWTQIGFKLIKISADCVQGRYCALPGASFWTRLKVKWLNFQLIFK